MELTEPQRAQALSAPLSVRAAVARRTVAVQLTALVAVSATAWAVLGSAMRAPWVVPDEIIYSDLAKSIAAGHLPAVRGVTTLGLGVGYPLLIAPPWVGGLSAHGAYVAVLAINALLMSSAAIPAYLLARRFVAHGSALAVASFAVLVPAMAYTSMILTENAYYPAFLFSLLAIVRALEHATARRQLVALASVGIAFAIKLLAVVLVPIYLTAVVVAALLGRDTQPVGVALRRYRPSWIATGALVGSAIVLSALRGHGATGVLGIYSGVFHHVDVIGIPWAFVLHLAAIDLSSGLIPFAATCLVVVTVARGRLRDERTRRFAALALACLWWLPATIALSAGAIKAGSAGIGANAHLHERYVFMPTPLFLAGLGICLERELSRRSRAALAAAAIATGLAAAIPVSHLRDNASLQAPSLIIWLLFRHGQLALALASLLVCACFVRVVRKTRALWGVVGTLFAVGAVLTYASSYATGASARDVGLGRYAGWIHAHAGTESVAVLWNEPGGAGDTAPPRPAQRVIWDNEFFSRTPLRVYAVGANGPEPIPTEVRARIGAGDVVLRQKDGVPVRSAYVLTCGIRLAAPIAAVDPDTGAILDRTHLVLRVRSVGRAVCQGRQKRGSP